MAKKPSKSGKKPSQEETMAASAAFDHGDTNVDPDIDLVQPSRQAATPPADSTPLPPTAAPHPRRLVLRAIQFGATQAQIDSVTTDELYDWIDTREQQARDFHMRQVQAQQPKQEEVKQPDEFGIDDEFEQNVHPSIKKVVKTMAEKFKKENEDLRGKLTAAEQREASRQTSNVNERINDAFASLPDKYRKIFGDVGHEEMIAKNMPEFKRRVAALNSSGVSPQALPSQRVLINKLQAAADELWPSAKEADAEPDGYSAAMSAATNGTNGKQRISKEQFESAALAKPTHRANKEPKGMKRAVQEVAKQMRENNMDDSFFDELTDEESSLPE